MKVSVHTKVEDGRLVTARKSLKKAVEQFEGKEITITIQRRKKQRSVMQNAYYWGVVVELIRAAIEESQGEHVEKEQVHELMKYKFHSSELLDEDTGEVLRLPRSTTSMSTTEYETYLNNVRFWAQEWLNIQIPLPNEAMRFES